MLTMRKDICETHIVGSRSREWRLDWQACPALAACGIGWAGWTDASRGYRFVRQTPTFTGLIICQGGTGQVWVDNRWQRCGAGMAYVLPAGVPHAYHANASGVWRICWVALDPAAGKAAVRGEGPCLVRLDPRPIRTAIDGLQHEISGPGEPAALQRWAELIHLYALRILQPQAGDERLWRLWEAVDIDPSRPWTLEELAGKAAVSPEHLRRLCHTQTHSSPMQHVTRLRLRRAAALLASTPQKIATVALAVGYASPFAFSTAFRRHIGIPPAEYRRTSREVSAASANGLRDPVLRPER